MNEQAWEPTVNEEEEMGPEMTDQQALVNTYVTMTLQLIQLDPWISVPRMMEALVAAGPLWTEGQILTVFEGWSVFRRTISRMEVVRGGTISGGLRNLPLTTRAPEGEPFGHTIPGWDGLIAWWAPQTGGSGPPFLFSIRVADREYLHRYPHLGTYTEDYEAETGSATDEGEEGNP